MIVPLCPSGNVLAVSRDHGQVLVRERLDAFDVDHRFAIEDRHAALAFG